jgi:antitoxin component YwqK of YwqJK toxin-antitoxin module
MENNIGIKQILYRDYFYNYFLIAYHVHNQKLKMMRNKIVQGIPCKGEVKYFENSKLNTCVLSKDFTIDEYLLPSSSKLFFNNEGKLDRCIISKATNFFDQVLPAKTNVFFNFWGEKLSFWLPEHTIIQGHLIGASDDGPGTPLYPNGKLKEIWLVNDELIDSIPCTTSGNIFKYGWHVMSMGTERRVKFYDNGHLQKAMLSRDVTIQGHSHKKGELIFFDKDGKIDLNVKK